MIRTLEKGPCGPTLLSDLDLHLFNEGRHARANEHLGAHPASIAGVSGTWFGVWAPNAVEVSVIGEFNAWRHGAAPLLHRANSGIWERFLPGVGHGAHYRYAIVGQSSRSPFEKIDPYANRMTASPSVASVVWDLDYTFADEEWQRLRGRRPVRESPLSIYEVHLGSWRRVPEEANRPLSYRELAPYLVEHARRLGFTHVELMPVMEHPFYGSWGYEITGYFAPSSRYGCPQDLMYLIDQLHQAGLGVILDWVPAHFPADDYGLSKFDGTHLYEHQDPRQGYHPDWHSAIFNYGRHEVRSFLISSACHWLRRYHADGLRIDGVASMLYLDYSRKPGEWVPNRSGGRENLEAIDLLQQLNQTIATSHPGTITFAEESTTWPMVTHPVHVGGLGFDFKWDMGWMHDTLRYAGRDPIYRRYHYSELTFRGMYAFSESFTLPLSHDEVAHGKGSLLSKMHGDDWQRFANLRLLFAWMWAQPGKKLLFMGGEFAQQREWDHDASLDWHLLDDPRHARIMLLVGMLNRLYQQEPALHQRDCDPHGVEWLEADDTEHSVLCLLRRAAGDAPVSIIVFNFTPVPRRNYRLGVDEPGFYREVINTDARELGGAGYGNLGGVEASPMGWKGHPFSLCLTLPPLGALFLLSE